MEEEEQEEEEEEEEEEEGEEEEKKELKRKRHRPLTKTTMTKMRMMANASLPFYQSPLFPSLVLSPPSFPLFQLVFSLLLFRLNNLLLLFLLFFRFDCSTFRDSILVASFSCFSLQFFHHQCPCSPRFPFLPFLPFLSFLSFLTPGSVAKQDQPSCG